MHQIRLDILAICGVQSTKQIFTIKTIFTLCLNSYISQASFAVFKVRGRCFVCRHGYTPTLTKTAGRSAGSPMRHQVQNKNQREWVTLFSCMPYSNTVQLSLMLSLLRVVRSNKLLTLVTVFGQMVHCNRTFLSTIKIKVVLHENIYRCYI